MDDGRAFHKGVGGKCEEREEKKEYFERSGTGYSVRRHAEAKVLLGLNVVCQTRTEEQRTGDVIEMYIVCCNRSSDV